MKTDTTIQGDTVTVDLDGNSGDDLEQVVRKYNRASYVIQNVEVDGAGTIRLIFRKVHLFENYR